MTYSRWTPSQGIRNIRIKPSVAARDLTDELARGTLDDGRTWAIWNRENGLVEAIYYHEPNQHGWIASEAHSLTHMIRADNSWSPYDLDMVS